MIEIFHEEMSGGQPIASWHIGEPMPFDSFNSLLYETHLIVVDGSELSLIHNVFEGLPYHNTEEPQIWTGDLARFILANLFPYEGDITRLHAFGGKDEEKFSWSKGERRDGTDLVEIIDTRYVVCHFNEISWLLANYKHIPYHKENSIQVWIGDMARFIVAQLPARDGQQ